MPKHMPVMVTGVGGGGHGEQILKALKLSDLGYFIVGGDMNAYSLGLTQVDAPYLLPPAGAVDYVDAVLEACRRHEVRALFHGSEPELKVMSEHRLRFEQAGVFLPINPARVIDLCMDKLSTSAWLQNHGFKVPRTLCIRTPEDLAAIDFCPAVLKPMVGGGGSANLFVAQDAAELGALGEYLLDNIGPYVVQEYVGTVDSEYTVGVLRDMHGQFLNSIAVHRMIMSGLSNRVRVVNRTGDPRFGKYLAISSGVSQGDVGPYPQVTQACEKIAAALDTRGAINIQCRYWQGEAYVFEINPRFSGTTSLRAMMGYNEPDLLIRRHLLGEQIPQRFEYRSGRVVRGLSEVVVPDRKIPDVFS
jgi:carbamoyl-phosphate synthase large subunit